MLYMLNDLRNTYILFLSHLSSENRKVTGKSPVEMCNGFSIWALGVEVTLAHEAYNLTMFVYNRYRDSYSYG